MRVIVRCIILVYALVISFTACGSNDDPGGSGQCANGHDHTESLICKRTDCYHQYSIGDKGPGGGIIYAVFDGQNGGWLGFEVEGVNIEGAYAHLSFDTYIAHYLEVAPEDFSYLAQWGAFGTEITGVTTNTDNQLIFDAGINGRRDTMLIVAHLGTTEIGRAAQICAAANYGGKDDWYLPGLGELLLYYGSNVEQKPTIGGYWSSSQHSSNSAWGLNFSGITLVSGSKYGDHYVRAVRAF